MASIDSVIRDFGGIDPVAVWPVKQIFLMNVPAALDYQTEAVVVFSHV